MANEVEQRKLAQSEALTNMEETTYKGVTLHTNKIESVIFITKK